MSPSVWVGDHLRGIFWRGLDAASAEPTTTDRTAANRIRRFITSPTLTARIVAVTLDRGTVSYYGFPCGRLHGLSNWRPMPRPSKLRKVSPSLASGKGWDATLVS